MVEGNGCDAAISCGQGAGRVACGSRDVAAAKPHAFTCNINADDIVGLRLRKLG